MRLGINDCFAVKRWPRAEEWAGIVRDRLGLTVVQHSFDLVPQSATLDDARVLGTVAAEAGIELHSTFTGLAAYASNQLLDPRPEGRQGSQAWYRWAIEWTSALGCQATGGHVGAYSVPDWQDPRRRHALWQDLGSQLQDLAGTAHRAGLAYLMVENLASPREPSTMAMMRDLLTSGDQDHVPVRLCIDVGHMCAPGTSGDDRDPYAWLRALGRHAPVVQLQQSDDAGDHHWPFTRGRNAGGRIAAERVIAALGEGGATDTVLILEVIPPFEQDDDEVLADLSASVDYWREALLRSGTATL